MQHVLFRDWEMLSESVMAQTLKKFLTLNLLTWRIWWALNNASKWQMGFNEANQKKRKRLRVC